MYSAILKEIPDKDFKKEAIRRRMSRIQLENEEDELDPRKRKRKRTTATDLQDLINRRKQGLGY